MKAANLPAQIAAHIIPRPGGQMVYHCLGCQADHGIDQLLYTCPDCGQVLLIQDCDPKGLQRLSGETWRQVFDYRKTLTVPALKGIFLFHEFIAPILPLEDIVYLGEGHTPVVEASPLLQERVGMRFFYKNDGQNPSASFKDRGMACALSYLRHMIRHGYADQVLAVCASTGDTSAAAALYAAYLQPEVKSAVLLPHKKVTPQQLSQPLGSGAAVFEIPGVFDDCMKVVEALADNYPVALLNSKNAWRILGQESYSFEIAQAFDYDLTDTVVVLPIGNAGNITAVMSGFIKFYRAGVIASLPKIVGVQSLHADPVVRYYSQPDPAQRRFVPVTVKPSTAQAAMIGNPVSMPRVIHLTDTYDRLSGRENVFFVPVAEQDIMDWQLTANRHGHIACTHGGECLAGLIEARRRNIVSAAQTAVLDATAHALKFAGFQEMYFENRFPADFQVSPKNELVNAPTLIHPADLEHVPQPGKPLTGEAFARFVQRVSEEIACRLNLSTKRGQP